MNIVRLYNMCGDSIDAYGDGDGDGDGLHYEYGA